MNNKALTTTYSLTTGHYTRFFYKKHEAEILLMLRNI